MSNIEVKSGFAFSLDVLAGADNVACYSKKGNVSSLDISCPTLDILLRYFDPMRSYPNELHAP